MIQSIFKFFFKETIRIDLFSVGNVKYMAKLFVLTVYVSVFDFAV